ncbi:alpha/beta hydrolase [Deinococcus sp. AJ005]|uniref:alpha/beta hydrolase n=1 Tax=Deinococcus sp. AJ005 TaxID=2652443 RepID=UPI00125CC9E0|nr:alpha/beta hydrolase [Deinococcus sp. AJ005]QFP76093.1 alpha/beta hydrolase [Deinococcus sp. AJ005]
MSMERVLFQSRGAQLVGQLHLPQTAGPHPAVVILGPVAFVKEQAPTHYAANLARAGYAALVFDPRFHGESQGRPRRFENGAAKVEDVQAALEMLAARSDVDAERLSLLGVCQGVNWMVQAAQDPRVRALALVAGHYLTPEVAALYLGGPEQVEQRIEKGRTARQAFEKSGEAEYIPVVNAPDALLLSPAIAAWYLPWEHRGRHVALAYKGLWENRLTAMSEELIWSHDVRPDAAQLTLPTLMIHASGAASGPQIPRQIFENIASTDKKLVWLGDQVQFQFYDDPMTIAAASTEIAAWFGAQG